MFAQMGMDRLLRVLGVGDIGDAVIGPIGGLIGCARQKKQEMKRDRRTVLMGLAALPALPIAAQASSVLPDDSCLKVINANMGKITASRITATAGRNVFYATEGGYGPYLLDNLGKLPDGAFLGEVIDPIHRIVRFSEMPLSSIEMYDGHAALSYERDCATIDELRAAQGRPGYYVTCLAEGVARPFSTFNGRPAYEWGALIR